jgi:DNA primase
MYDFFKTISKYCIDNRGEIFNAYTKSRNWSKETLDKWQIGFFPDDDILSLKIKLKQAGILEEEIAINGIGRKDRRSLQYKSLFFGRIIFPVFDTWGNPIAITGRTLDPKIKPKYFNTIFEKSKILYGLNYAIDSVIVNKRVYVFEGNADVVSAHQFGIENSVCCMGTTFSEDHFILLSRYAKEIVLIFDNDDGGRKALSSFNKKKVEDSKSETKLYRCMLKDYKDVDEQLNKAGKDSVLQHIEASINNPKEQLRLKSI